MYLHTDIDNFIIHVSNFPFTVTVHSFAFRDSLDQSNDNFKLLRVLFRIKGTRVGKPDSFYEKEDSLNNQSIKWK